MDGIIGNDTIANVLGRVSALVSGGGGGDAHLGRCERDESEEKLETWTGALICGGLATTEVARNLPEELWCGESSRQ